MKHISTAIRPLIIALPLYLLIPSPIHAQSARVHAIGRFANNGETDTDDSILGARDFKTLVNIMPSGTAFNGVVTQANMSSWVILDKTSVDPRVGTNRCPDHVEVGILARCPEMDGCGEGESGKVQRRRFLFERGWVKEISNNVVSYKCTSMWAYQGGVALPALGGTVEDFVLIARDSSGENWWGGISGAITGGIGWKVTGNFAALHDEGFCPNCSPPVGPDPGNDGGHRIDTGIETTNFNSGSVDFPVTHMTEIESTLQLGSGWNSWPQGNYIESGHLHWNWKTNPTHGCAGSNETNVDNC